MKRFLLICLALSVTANIALGAKKSKKTHSREFRAVWVATVNNIDWPSRPGLSVEQQKTEIRKLLDLHKSDGMNAIIMQVRPSADAFYSSPTEPWSRYLQGNQGTAPEPFYDPLDYFIEQCHLRGMEFHPWFNPYRIKQSPKDQLVPQHIFNRHPDWGWSYGDRTYFDPGQPEVRNYLTDVVRDVVQRYDIDAIHFDDYFYPYKIEGEPLPDAKTFKQFPRNFKPSQIDDWRRDNVNIIIQMLNQTIKEVKPWVKFGISPFGVWRNGTSDPEGSNTRAGTTNYDDLYADIIHWLREGWIDYALPQLYWEIGHPSVDFSELATWWGNHTYQRAMYIGHALYKLDQASKSAAWREPDELIKQIQIVRANPKLSGSAWYSSVHFKRNLNGLREKMQLNGYQYQAIIPTMPWIDNTPPEMPQHLRLQNTEGGQLLTWQKNEKAKPMEQARFFAIYGSSKKSKVKKCDPSVLIDITGSNKLFFKEQNGRKSKKFYYSVTALDRGNNESIPSEIITIRP